MDIRFGTRTRAMHQSINRDLSPKRQPLSAISPTATLDPAELHEPSPHNAGRLRMAVVFLAGLVSGLGLAWYEHTVEIELIHGYAKKAGFLHVDPTGIEFWDARINGARGTNGLSGYQ